MNTDEIFVERPFPRIITIHQPSVLDKLMFSPHKKMLYPRLAQMMLSMNVVESFNFTTNIFNERVASATFIHHKRLFTSIIKTEHSVSWSTDGIESYFIMNSSALFPLDFNDMYNKLFEIYTCVLKFTRERGRKAQNVNALRSLLPKEIVSKVAEFVEDRELPELYKKALGHVKYAFPDRFP